MDPTTADQMADHLTNCIESKADAWIVCDSGVSGDDPINAMLATGMWTLSDKIEYFGGKRIRTLVPVVPSESGDVS